jgi:predicted nucleotidyltransferase component of viral defense system
MKDREELLLKVMHLMSEHFKDRIVLEGGMLLRLLNSPRATQDVDYLLVSESSKKELAGEIKNVLLKLGEISVKDIKLNSRGVFIDLEGRDEPSIKAFLEINVVTSLLKPPSSMSTVALAGRYSMTGRIVAAMELSEAFAHKICAAIERESMRDLYDLTILEPLCEFDAEVLRKRLSNLSIKRQKARNITIAEAADMLKTRVQSITQEKVERELGAWLLEEAMQGMYLIIRATLNRIAQKLLLFSSLQS